MRSLNGVLLFCAFSLLLGACQLDRRPLSSAPERLTWDVSPQLFCPGDPVTVSWDFSDMRKSRANCRPPNGGFDTLMSCTSSSSCPGGSANAVCLDSHCCRRDLYEMPGSLMCDAGRGCYPPFNIDIAAGTEAIVEDENNFVRGERTVSPDDTTTFTISGLHTDPLFMFEESKTVTMVRPVPPTVQPVPFPFICAGVNPGWAQFTMDDPVLATEHVQIAGVRNTSGHIIRLGRTGPDTGPVTLRPGDTTTMFNGPVRGLWTAALDPLDRARLSVPICRPTFTDNPWPDLQVELILQCVAMP